MTNLRSELNALRFHRRAGVSENVIAPRQSVFAKTVQEKIAQSVIIEWQLMAAGSTGQRNTLIFWQDGVWTMKQRRRIYYSSAQRSEIWDRWQAGESMSSIGRRSSALDSIPKICVDSRRSSAQPPMLPLATIERHSMGTYLTNFRCRNNKLQTIPLHGQHSTWPLPIVARASV